MSLNPILFVEPRYQEQKGQKALGTLNHDYSSVNVTTGAYVELSSSLVNDVSRLEIFDSSGEIIILAIGAIGSEVDTIDIQPGGNDEVKMDIAKGQRLSIKSRTANATSGNLSINLFQ